MEQRHSGSGDNVAGNKTTINNVSIPKLIGFTLLGVSVFVVAYLLWPDPVYLSGYVYSSGGQPVEGASLAVQTPAGQEYQSVTNTAGFFQFDGLKIAQATAGRLSVQADVRELSLGLDTVALTENGLRLQLPPGTPPFRITYYNLGAHAIDEVMQGRLAEELGGKLARDVVLIPNSVQRYYQLLLDAHGTTLNEYTFIRRPWSETETVNAMTLAEAARFTDYNVLYLPGKGGTATTDYEVQAELRREQVVRLLESTSWTQVSDLLPDNFDYENQQPASSLLAVAWLDKTTWQQLSQEMIAGREWAMNEYLQEARQWEGEYAETARFREDLRHEYLDNLSRNIAFWDALIGEELPPQLIGAEITQGPGCATTSFHVRLKMPELFLQVAVLENTTETSIRLDTFVFRSQEAQPLRAEEAVRTAWAETPVQRDRLYPQEQLAPGEKIIIPRYLYAQTPDRAYYEPAEARFHGIRSAEYVRDPDRERPAYVFGPAFRIETVLLGPERFAFRGFDRERLVLIDGIEAGSCPYAYTRAHAGAPWRLEDHLIYGRRRRAWEGTDTLDLHQFDGTLLIRERDPETSYLQHAYLLVQRRDGPTEQLDPDEPRLRAANPDYYRLERGDSLLLRFPGFRARPGDRYRLVNAGYYLPYLPEYSYRLQAAVERIGSLRSR